MSIHYHPISSVLARPTILRPAVTDRTGIWQLVAAEQSESAAARGALPGVEAADSVEPLEPSTNADPFQLPQQAWMVSPDLLAPFRAAEGRTPVVDAPFVEQEVRPVSPPPASSGPPRVKVVGEPRTRPQPASHHRGRFHRRRGPSSG